MRVPLSWLREYVDFDLPIVDVARRLAISSLEVDRVIELGVPDTDGNLGLFRIGRVVEAGKAPERRPAPALSRRRGRGRAAPDRLRRLELRPRRDGRRRAPRRVPARARRAARRGEAPRRAVARDDPLRAGAPARRRPRGDHGARERARAGHAARGRPADHGRGARGDADDEPRRPALRLRPRPGGGGAVRRRAQASPRRGPARLGRRAGGRAHRGLRRLPALHRPCLHGRRGRALAGVAARAAARPPGCARSRTSST